MDRRRSGQLGLLIRKPLTVIVFVGICVLSSMGGYVLLTAPRYIVLQIESPSSYLSRGDWILTSEANYYYTDKSDRYFVRRQETEVYTTAFDPRSPFDTWIKIREYFESRISKSDWTPYPNDTDNICTLFLAEAKFISMGTDGYTIYKRPGVTEFAVVPTVCLAIWPSRQEQNQINAYSVVILTINPSYSTGWKSQLDLGW